MHYLNQNESKDNFAKNILFQINAVQLTFFSSKISPQKVHKISKNIFFKTDNNKNHYS